MVLQLVVDKLDSVPEALRGEYAEKDGKFHLNVDGLEDTSGLKSALQKERTQRADLEKKAKQWESLGKSPDEINEMLESERKKAEAAALKAGKFDEVLAQHLGKAKQERDEAVSKADKEREAALGLARKAITDTRLAGALAKAKATAEGLDLLTERLGRRVKIDFADGGSAVEAILDNDGKPMVGKGANGLATFEDLVSESIKQYPSLFEASGTGGSGTNPKASQNRSGDKVIRRADFEALAPMERSQKMQEKYRVVD